MYKLQTLIFSNAGQPATYEMYFHCCDKVLISSVSNGGLYLPKQASVFADTFFNGFSVGKWQRICKFDDLNLALTGHGRALVRIGINVLDHSSQWLYENEIILSDEPAIIEISAFPNLPDGIIFFQIIAVDDLTLSGGYYFTRSPPPNDVTLGIVVTHFNRQHYILPAIRRVTEQLLNDPEMENRISMIVVDNSQNIATEEAGGAVVIPNQNLGGAGGFTRGLIYAKDNNFSHCLFMDDDASCEIESIRRTFRIMQYAKSPKMAFAGSMMREDAPSFIHEAGAVWRDMSIHSLKFGLDLKNVQHLLLAESECENISYGAWWHFAFRIDQVKHFAFPFFVRGDDILFSLSNDFEIFTMNGVGEWAEAFELKESPVVRYLDFRAQLVLGLLQSSRGASHSIRKYRRRIRSSLFSYNYSSARAFTLAVQHVMKGPDFWRDNLDMTSVREELARLCPGEKISNITLPHDIEIKASRKNYLRYFLRKITLNGFMLPEFFIKDKTVIDSKNFNGDAQKIFLNRRVIYTMPNKATGYLAEYSKLKFWKEFWLSRRTAREYRRKFAFIKKQYHEEFPELTSEKFWRKVFDGR